VEADFYSDSAIRKTLTAGDGERSCSPESGAFEWDYLTSDEIAYYKSAGFFVDLPESAKPITGHIDVVQVRNGFIHLLDYKPQAGVVDPVNQLLVYALALASRTRLPVERFRCAWFDERDYFEFFPLQAVRARGSRTFILADGTD
jgi:ATP-dependent exoDNAse (exonuclease V) beta subunit